MAPSIVGDGGEGNLLSAGAARGDADGGEPAQQLRLIFADQLARIVKLQIQHWRGIVGRFQRVDYGTALKGYLAAQFVHRIVCKRAAADRGQMRASAGGERMRWVAIP